jgi:hypothetical protein
MKNWRALLAMAMPLALAACTVSPTPPQPLESHLASAERARFASAPPDRPGLGTKWGEKRISLVGTTSFERANFNHPFAAAAIYYNDEGRNSRDGGHGRVGTQGPGFGRASRGVGDD